MEKITKLDARAARPRTLLIVSQKNMISVIVLFRDSERPWTRSVLAMNSSRYRE
jgi:hypothetical protein